MPPAALQVPRGYWEAFYKWDTSPDNSFYFMPHEHGAQMVLQVQLEDPPNATAKFLTSTSATEITQTFLAQQLRFSTSQDYVDLVWNDLELDESVLSATAIHQIQLTYDRVP